MATRTRRAAPGPAEPRPAAPSIGTPWSAARITTDENGMASGAIYYDADGRGCWFFQNGPQRVYVELEAAPWVWRLSAGAPCRVHAHTGDAAQPQAAWLDERGRVFLACDRGLGLVHSLDTELAADALERGEWPLQELPFSALPGRFGYVLQPRAAA